MQGRVLVIAGSDSGGGAGIQADIKTITALGGFAATAITALTAQDTLGVHEVVALEPRFVARQIEVVLSDIGADAVKIGMLHDVAVMEAVCNALDPIADEVPIVLDPVMVATDGTPLLETNAVAMLKRRAVFLATLITPNIPEAEALTGRHIPNRDAMTEVAYMLPTLGCRAALLTGGHLDGPTVVDMLATAEGLELFEYPRIETKNTHGTGCTLASAIAVGLAQGLSLRDAVARARAYIQEAIRTAPEIGRGKGPLNHGHTVKPFSAP